MQSDGVGSSVSDLPDVETIGAGGGPRDDPFIPCHVCGTEERFMAMKRDPEWTLEYLDPPRWVAYCPDCDPRNNRLQDTDTGREEDDSA